MGALIMFTLVIVIANVGGFYFYFHDKKRVAKEFRLRQRVRSGQKSNQKNDDANRRHTAFLQEIFIRGY